MTVEEFMLKFNLKNKKTVLNWIEKGYIVGVKTDPDSSEYIIPTNAKPPFTENRAKTPKSIMTSIVKGVLKGKSVCAKLYNIEDQEFDSYIKSLAKENIIAVESDGENNYYYATPGSREYLSDSPLQKKFLLVLKL